MNFVRKTEHAPLRMAGACLLAAGLLGAASLTRTEAKTGHHITWQPSMTAALREARRTHRPIAADFAATWCGPCHMLDRETWSNTKLINESRRWVFVKVDVDQHQELAQKYRVTALPTVAFLTSRGEVVSSFVGFHDAGDTLKLMRAARARAVR